MTDLVLSHTIDDVRTRILELRHELRAADDTPPRVVLVPTMGALHAGHLALIRRATELGEIVVVSIFVNPLQFGEDADLQAYPRTLDADLALLRAADVAVVFAPNADEMYPAGEATTRITGGAVSNRLEGRSRRGHFDGVLTVVAKLFAIVAPDVAVFGRKDAQQAFLVSRMVADLNLPIEVVAVDTVREDDGLAMSSRNRRLSPRERDAARSLYRALEAAVSSADGGVDSAVAAAQSALAGEALVTLDYVAIVEPSTFAPVGDDYRGPVVILIAAMVGETRLIDNESAYLGQPSSVG